MDQQICIDTRFGLKVRLHEHIDGADLQRSLLVFAVRMAVDFTVETFPCWMRDMKSPFARRTPGNLPTPAGMIEWMTYGLNSTSR